MERIFEEVYEYNNRNLSGIMQQTDANIEGGAFNVKVEKYNLRFHKFEVLDEVIAAFFATNHRDGDGVTFDMDAVMRLRPADGKIYTKYLHATVPYLSSLFTVNGSDGMWVNLKLANNGFVYVSKEGTVPHQSLNFILLPWNRCISYFTSLHRLIDGRFNRASVHYNFLDDRFDIKLHATPPAPSLIIRFEPGYPYHEDDDEYSELIPCLRHSQ